MFFYLRTYSSGSLLCHNANCDIKRFKYELKFEMNIWWIVLLPKCGAQFVAFLFLTMLEKKQMWCSQTLILTVFYEELPESKKVEILWLNFIELYRHAERYSKTIDSILQSWWWELVRRVCLKRPISLSPVDSVKRCVCVFIVNWIKIICRSFLHAGDLIQYWSAAVVVCHLSQKLLYVVLRQAVLLSPQTHNLHTKWDKKN